MGAAVCAAQSEGSLIMERGSISVYRSNTQAREGFLVEVIKVPALLVLGIACFFIVDSEITLLPGYATQDGPSVFFTLLYLASRLLSCHMYDGK